jgi:hypothetical protein
MKTTAFALEPKKYCSWILPRYRLFTNKQTNKQINSYSQAYLDQQSLKNDKLFAIMGDP